MGSDSHSATWSNLVGGIALGPDAAEEVRSSSLSTPSTSGYHAAVAPDVVVLGKAAPRRADQYAAMIYLLGSHDGDKHVSTGLAMLVQDVLDAGTETQRLVLTAALRELMDAAVWPKLSDKDQWRDKVGIEGGPGALQRFA